MFEPVTCLVGGWAKIKGGLAMEMRKPQKLPFGRSTLCARCLCKAEINVCLNTLCLLLLCEKCRDIINKEGDIHLVIQNISQNLMFGGENSKYTL